ncbi:MAG TPA: peptidylprolyl isomerase [Candidatus Nanoarchaeia archaeon]|nr:peptidylprolyl isomerase [Candidatus Nanoarchaeia archaeon]
MAQQVRAAHILVKGEEKAKELLQKIRTGSNFEKLAEENSLCPSKKKGGDLGWFGRGMMVREFEQAAFNLEKGHISPPVKTEFGWHIIKCLDKK